MKLSVVNQVRKEKLSETHTEKDNDYSFTWVADAFCTGYHFINAYHFDVIKSKLRITKLDVHCLFVCAFRLKCSSFYC